MVFSHVQHNRCGVGECFSDNLSHTGLTDSGCAGEKPAHRHTLWKCPDVTAANAAQHLLNDMILTLNNAQVLSELLHVSEIVLNMTSHQLFSDTDDCCFSQRQCVRYRNTLALHLLVHTRNMTHSLI